MPTVNAVIGDGVTPVYDATGRPELPRDRGALRTSPKRHGCPTISTRMCFGPYAVPTRRADVAVPGSCTSSEPRSSRHRHRPGPPRRDVGDRRRAAWRSAVYHLAAGRHLAVRESQALDDRQPQTTVPGRACLGGGRV